MATYFAQLDDKNIVTQVIVADQSFVDSIGGKWVETFENGSQRYNYAGIGYSYDPDHDAFHAPQPFPSWTLDEKFQWQAPVAMPTDGALYSWNETDKAWEKINV